MIKNNKLKLALASSVTLLPVPAGILLWNELPEYFATHWGVSGEADGFSVKAFGVFGIPIILLALFWLCVIITDKDPKNKNQNKKALGMVLWIVPVLSCVLSGVVYALALGKELNMSVILSLLLGLMFIGIGNYMPKCSQNFTLGIKIKWTLQNEDNWNKTHRFAGKVWVIGGLCLLLFAFLPENVFMIALLIFMLPMVLIPMLYSYLYHKKQLREGNAVITPYPKTKFEKKLTVFSLAAIAVILVFVAVIMFTGDIDVEISESSFTVDSVFYDSLTVEYSEIDSMEFREDLDIGVRTNGFASARLLMGTFKNEELGYYTLYTYTNCNAFTVIKSGDKTLVLGGKDEADARSVYERLALNK